MTRVRTTPTGVRSPRRLGRERDDGIRSVARITRLALAASVAFAAVFSAFADVAFPGRSATSTSGERTVSAAAESVRVALPPRNGGETLTPPVTGPAPAAGGSVATSGGS